MNQCAPICEARISELHRDTALINEFCPFFARILLAFFLILRSQIKNIVPKMAFNLSPIHETWNAFKYRFIGDLNFLLRFLSRLVNQIQWSSNWTRISRDEYRWVIIRAQHCLDVMIFRDLFYLSYFYDRLASFLFINFVIVHGKL